MRMGKNFEIVGILGLQKVGDDEFVSAIELDADFLLLPPEVTCPALETYIAIMQNILDDHEAEWIATSQGDQPPNMSPMN
jgi:hypothetical protein